MIGWLGYFATPPDAVSWAAFGVAVVCLLAAYAQPSWLRQAFAEEHHPKLVALLAAIAALLSVGYVAYYLRGGPRIIDATTYYLEARALARGWLAFPVLEPTASFRGRFLVMSEDVSTLGAIFPPGYPLVLALGFVVGAPLLVGPAIAAGIVFVTHALTRQLTGRADVALLAAALSSVSAVLRYHTADTMSHGWCALLFSLALLGLLRTSRGWWLVGGVAAGWLIASRPFSGLALMPLAVMLVAQQRKAWWFFGLAMLPALVLLVLHQRAVTGHWLVSSQQFYYQLADGPPGCFAYGFGADVGCRFEHGHYVEAVMADGFGWREAWRTTWARFHFHLRDAANFQLAVIFLLAGAATAFRNRRLWIPIVGVVTVIAAYAPFYYDGSYPGGGARFYADVLPLEHLLLAQGFFLLRAWRFALPLALLGFAVQTTFDHRSLAHREGGRPMFDPSVLRQHGTDRGLVFLETDHGFNLAYDPARRDARESVVFARARGDANDRLLWERLGRPDTYRYVYDPGAAEGTALVEPYVIQSPPAYRFEAEHQWPALAVANGWVHPDFPACASKNRGLRLRGVSDVPLEARLRVFVPSTGHFVVKLGWAAVGPGPVDLEAGFSGRKSSDRSLRRRGQCWVQQLGAYSLVEGGEPLVVRSVGEAVVLDYVELHSAE